MCSFATWKRYFLHYFDVMEHLPIHLSRKEALAVPVKYIWMYPFEWYIFHVKKNSKI